MESFCLGSGSYGGDGCLESNFQHIKLYWLQCGTWEGNWKQYKQSIKLSGHAWLCTSGEARGRVATLITEGNGGDAHQSDDADVFMDGELRRMDAREGDRAVWARWFIATQLWWHSEMPYWNPTVYLNHFPKDLCAVGKVTSCFSSRLCVGFSASNHGSALTDIRAHREHFDWLMLLSHLALKSRHAFKSE